MITVDINPKQLGTLQIGKANSFEYILSSGADEIIITKITAGCGSCTMATMDSSKIAPNTSEAIKVTFTPNALGATTKRVTLTYTEAGTTKSIVLEFIATIIN